MDGNLAALSMNQERLRSGEELFEKMLDELREVILDDSEESESTFNKIVGEYSFEYNFIDFVGDEL